MAQIGGEQSKRKLRIIGIFSLVVLLFLFCLVPESIGVIILFFPLALILNSKKPATLAVALIGISLILQQFIGAGAYAYLTGIIGLILALLIIPPWPPFGIGLLITLLVAIISVRRMARKHD